MSLNNILTLFGGLSLFLLGMDLMGDGLEAACGSKMKSILKKLTSNRFVGVLVGMVITAIIQSSSATTVMVVGFVNAGMMTLSQAIWVIMGANIGTTITGLLIALDVGIVAPIFAIIGVVMMLFIKKPLIQEIGKILAGFGILFIGMDMMSTSMVPLRDSELFIGLMTKFSNPILGILAGIVFTAIIQSSSASVGILQALALSGAIGLESAAFVLFGMNIGTCVTALLASMSANRNAKRTTLIHFLFNIIGTIMFTILCFVTPLIETVKGMSENASLQIANMHIIFNIITTLILIPFGLYLVKLTEIILPDKKEKEESIFEFISHDINVHLGNSALHLENIRREVERMYKLAKDNIDLSFNDIVNKNTNNRDIVIKNEDLIDRLNEGIIKNITASMPNESNPKINEKYGAYLVICNNIERIADHAMNLDDENYDILNSNLVFSEAVEKEIIEIRSKLDDMFSKTMDKTNLEAVKQLEEIIDDVTEQNRLNMLKRLKASICTAEGSIAYSTLLINFERIGDHLLNINEELQKI